MVGDDKEAAAAEAETKIRTIHAAPGLDVLMQPRPFDLQQIADQWQPARTRQVGDFTQGAFECVGGVHGRVFPLSSRVGGLLGLDPRCVHRALELAQFVLMKLRDFGRRRSDGGRTLGFELLLERRILEGAPEFGGGTRDDGRRASSSWQ